MKKEQCIALENLQRIAMDYVQIATAIDKAVQDIKKNIKEAENSEILILLIKMHMNYLNDVKAVFGDFNAREIEAWNNLVSTISTERES